MSNFIKILTLLKESTPKKAIKGASLVFENDKCWVYSITDENASKAYSAGTQWGISNFNTHMKNGTKFYFIFTKQEIKPKTLNKVAVSKSKGRITIYDSIDNEVNIDLQKTFGIDKSIF